MTALWCLHRYTLSPKWKATMLARGNGARFTLHNQQLEIMPTILLRIYGTECKSWFRDWREQGAEYGYTLELKSSIDLSLLLFEESFIATCIFYVDAVHEVRRRSRRFLNIMRIRLMYLDHETSDTRIQEIVTRAQHQTTCSPFARRY